MLFKFKSHICTGLHNERKLHQNIFTKHREKKIQLIGRCQWNTPQVFQPPLCKRANREPSCTTLYFSDYHKSRLWFTLPVDVLLKSDIANASSFFSQHVNVWRQYSRINWCCPFAKNCKETKESQAWTLSVALAVCCRKSDLRYSSETSLT